MIWSFRSSQLSRWDGTPKRRAHHKQVAVLGREDHRGARINMAVPTGLEADLPVDLALIRRVVDDVSDLRGRVSPSPKRPACW